MEARFRSEIKLRKPDVVLVAEFNDTQMNPQTKKPRRQTDMISL